MQDYGYKVVEYTSAVKKYFTAKDGRGVLYIEPSHVVGSTYSASYYFDNDPKVEEILARCKFGGTRVMSDDILTFLDAIDGQKPKSNISFIAFYLKSLGINLSGSTIAFKNCAKNDFTINNLVLVPEALSYFTEAKVGYNICSSGFKPTIKVGKNYFSPFGVVKNESEACQLQYKLETEWLYQNVGQPQYQYNFCYDLKHDPDILHELKTGVITQDEAVFKHIKRYASNSWFVLRYNLQPVLQQFGLPFPEYKLNDKGIMISVEHGKILNPYYQNGNTSNWCYKGDI